MLIKGLPRDALVRTPVEERGRDPWTAELELMAQLIEMTSVIAAEHRIKKPVKIPRPNKVKVKSTRDDQRVRRAADIPAANPYQAAIAALGGAQPSRKREQLATEPIETDPEDNGDGMTPPAPRGSYSGAIAMFAASQPRKRNGGSPA